MVKDIFSAMVTTASIFRSRKAILLLGAGLVLIVACATPNPAGDDVEIPLSGGVGVSSPQSNGDSRAPTDTPAPIQQPSAGNSAETNTTDSEAANRRPLPNNVDGSARRIPDTPVAEPSRLLPENTLALVMAVRGGSSSSTLKTIINDSSTGEMLGTKFIQLESSSKSVVLYLPDTGESMVLDSYSSPSYAPRFKRPYTVDGRLYVSNKSTNGGALSITEYDTATLSRKSGWSTQKDALDPGYAVAGGRVYFKTGSTQQWSMSRGFYDAPGDYLSSPFDDGWETIEMERPKLRFSLVSGGETLYGAKLPSESDPITGVFTVNPDTGQPADSYITAFEIEDWDDYLPTSWQSVVIADGIAYWAGFLNGPANYSVEILAADLTDPDIFTVYGFDMPTSEKEITGFYSAIDADGGYVLIKPSYEGGDRSRLLIYDTANETVQLIDTGFHIVDVQVIFIEE